MNSQRPPNEESFDEPWVSVAERVRRIDNNMSPTRKFSAMPLPKTIDYEVSVRDRLNEIEDQLKPAVSPEQETDEPWVSIRERARRIDDSMNPTRKFSTIPLLKSIDSKMSVKDRVNEIDDRLKPEQKTVPTKELNSSLNFPSLKQPSQRFNKINSDGQFKRQSMDSGFDSEPEDYDSTDESFIDQATMKSMANDLSKLLNGRKPSTSNTPQFIVPTSTSNEFQKASINDPSQLSFADRIKLINSKLFNN